MKKEFELITQIREHQSISREQFETLMMCEDAQVIDFLHQQAREVADGIYENKVYIRGLIEFTNYCKNDCLYCGIRRSNAKANRYRLTKEEILE